MIWMKKPMPMRMVMLMGRLSLVGVVVEGGVGVGCGLS
jgi:hypothetical protein